VGCGRNVTDTLRIADGKLAEYWANATACWSSSSLASGRFPPKG